MTAILELDALHVQYGPILALQGVSLRVEEGSITSLIGSNGAGKTTMLRAITGLVRCTSGHAIMNGTQELCNQRASLAVRRGLGHVPEGRQVFGDLTVLENLHLGAYHLRGRSAPASEVRRMFDYFPRLEERMNQRAGTMSGGEQQMLVIAMALISRPRLLLLDEPSLGLAPLVVAQILETLCELNASEGLSILIVEQNIAAALRICSYGYVLASGRVAIEGTGVKLAQDESVRKHYLGSIGSNATLGGVS